MRRGEQRGKVGETGSVCNGKETGDEPLERGGCMAARRD